MSAVVMVCPLTIASGTGALGSPGGKGRFTGSGLGCGATALAGGRAVVFRRGVCPPILAEIKSATPVTKKYFEKFMKTLYSLWRLECKQRSDVASNETNAAQR